jgi:hypothetical protein
MDAFVGYARQYEFVIYAILGIFALWHVRQFIRAWDTLRGAAFGVERYLAQRKLNQAAGMLVLTLVIFVTQFSIVAYFAPALPGALPLPTSTMDLEATVMSSPAIQPTPTVTLSPETTPGLEGPPTPAVTALPTAGFTGSSACVEGQVIITQPADGSEVSGIVQLVGTATLENFGFYKYEVARPGDTVWLSINANDQPVENGPLGEWITMALPVGDYLLRLVVIDNQGIAQPACVIRVRVIAPTAEPN